MFTIRVYGIFINKQKQILVSDELIKGEMYTKFPGGGLEFGEGTRACLEREFREEMKVEVDVLEHIFTTDFFVESKFAPGVQVISIYYRVHIATLPQIEVKNIGHTDLSFREGNVNLTEKHRLVDMHRLHSGMFQLPIDKKVVEMLRRDYS